ncbi:hypothetical protein Tco_0523759 [Tanacetum coccineum]
MEHYQMFVEVFGIDVLLTRSQPTESTHGTHRTTSAPRSPNPDKEAAESSAPRRSTVIRLRIPERRSIRLTPPAPVLTVDKADEMILQDTLQVSLAEHKSREEQEARENMALVDEHLASEEIEKMVDEQENIVDDSSIPRNDESNIPVIRTKKYVELSAAQKIQADCDMKATYIILQGLPADIYSLCEYHKSFAKDLCNQDPLAFVCKTADDHPPHFNTYHSSYNNPQLQQQRGQCYYSRKYYKWTSKSCLNATTTKKPQEAVPILDETGDWRSRYLRILNVNDSLNLARYIKFKCKAVLMDNISNYGSDIISEAQQDSMILSVIKQMSEQMINHVNNWEKANKEQNNESITAELERYKEMVKTFEQRLYIDLSCLEKIIDSQMDDMIREKLALKEQVDSLEQNLSKQIKENESLFKTFTIFKNESKEKENKYMENEIDLEKKIKELIILFVKWMKNTLSLEEESRSKMSEKVKDPEVIAKKISHKPIDYEKLNRLTEDFGKKISPQQELSAEQAFWFHIVNPSIKSSYTPLVIMNVPSKLPKASLVNASLNKLKFHLTQFDSVVKKRTTPNALEEENTKEQNINHDKCELEPINKELENSVAKLLSENERLCNEINHVKQVFKDQFDSIKQTRVRHKEQSDSLINKLNLKSVENEDLKAQIQDKVFVITSLKNNLQKLKGKEIVENVVHTPSATTIAPGMFKLDLVPLPPRLLQNRDAHIDYLRHTQEQVNTLREIVEQAKTKQPLDKELDFAYKSKPLDNKKNDRISQTPSRNKKNKVEAQPRKVNKTNRVVKPICDVDVKHSLSNVNSKILCATCNKSVFDGVHDKCLLDLVQNGNNRTKSG